LLLDDFAPQLEAHFANHAAHALAANGLELGIVPPQLMCHAP